MFTRTSIPNLGGKSLAKEPTGAVVPYPFALDDKAEKLMSVFGSFVVDRLSSCLSCGKKCGEEVELFACSQCRLVNYCSEECQKKDWKDHKKNCRIRQEAKEKAEDNGLKRELRLKTYWMDKAKMVITKMCGEQFSSDELLGMVERKAVVLLTVEFDYNRRTFVPLRDPVIVENDDEMICTPWATNIIRNWYREVEKKNEACGEKAEIDWVVLIRYNGRLCFSPAAVSCARFCETAEKYSAEFKAEMAEQSKSMLRHIPLKSKIFDMWPTIMAHNLREQLATLPSKTPHFFEFSANALHMETKKKERRLHKTHVIRITMEMGWGLGEVKALTGYDVVPVEEIITDLQSKVGSLITTEEMEYYQKHFFDLNNAPSLLEARKQKPHCALTPVIFDAPGYVSYILPMVTEPGQKVVSVSKANNLAKQHFEGLKSYKLPPVASPSLE